MAVQLIFSKCTQQSYNAANMACRCHGTQQKLVGKSKYAIHIQCAGHMLNFVGNAVNDCYLEAVYVLAIVLSY
jgi:hypothetical protein